MSIDSSAKIKPQLEKLRAERDQHLQRRGRLEEQCKRCAELAQEQEQLREKLQDSQRQAWIYQQLDKAFGKDGIQALIIENAVPQIADEANAILARLTDNRIQVAFESLRDLKKGGTRETLDVKIADEIGERSYHLYSGGEAFRTNFALRIALSKVLAMRSGTRLHTPLYRRGLRHPRRARAGTTHRSHPKNQRGFQKGVDCHSSRPTQGGLSSANRGH